MTLEELKATDEEREVLQLWEVWQDAIITGDPIITAPLRSKELAVAHYKEAGLTIKETSPLAFMFAGFLGGVQLLKPLLEAVALGDAGEGAEYEAL